MKFLKRFFKKNIDSSSQQLNTLIQQKWSLKKTTTNGHPTIVMKNESFVTTAGFIKDYPINCVLAFRLLQPREDGLHNIVKEPRLKKLDNEVFETFETDMLAIIAAIVTCQQVRQYIIYTKDLQAFTSRLTRIQCLFNEYRIMTCNEYDSAWENYYSIE